MSYEDAIINTLLGLCAIVIVAIFITFLVFEPMVIVAGVAGLLVILLIAYVVMKISHYKDKQNARNKATTWQL
jgi:maltodextrin utilization protein YvdJ